MASVAVAGAAALPLESTAAETSSTGTTAKSPTPSVMPPSAQQIAAERGTPADLPKAATGASTGPMCGADFMLDVLKSLKLDFIFSNPGSSFRALHESVVNYGHNEKPEFITCLHEESSAAMAHGYAKAAGYPAAIFAHGTVGLQHAAMGLYNAWCDRAPILTILGNQANGVNRRPNIDWVHAAQDPAAMARDFTKWDDNPQSLQHFAESTVRAFRITQTAPMGPVAVVADQDLQENPIPNLGALSIPKLGPVLYPQGDANAVREVAKLLVAAENPVIIADRYARTPAAMTLLIELAELLTIPVVDTGNRANFPNTHFLAQGANYAKNDVILGLEVSDFFGILHEFIDDDNRTTTSRIKEGTKLISIGTAELFVGANYQDFQRFNPVDIAIPGDAETTMPALIEEVKQVLTNERKATLAGRADGYRKAKLAAFNRSREEATWGWDASPISTARLAVELWDQVKNEDWAMVSPSSFGWIRRFWTFDKHYRTIGNSGGEGVGYGLPASVGAALAHRKHGRFCINIQKDGDFMYANGAMWTAAHHKIPMLTVMFNNRGYHQEIMHLQKFAARWNRGLENTKIGTLIYSPDIDYAKLAQGMGVWAEKPVIDPKELAGALRRAIAMVKQGAPALVDVVTQPR